MGVPAAVCGSAEPHCGKIENQIGLSVCGEDEPCEDSRAYQRDRMPRDAPPIDAACAGAFEGHVACVFTGIHPREFTLFATLPASQERA